MTAVLVSACAGLAVLVAILLALLVRSRAAASRDAAEALGHASKALETARSEGRRDRLLAGLVGVIDLDEVLARTLAAATGLPGVDAAMVVMHREEGGPLIATRGLSVEEAEQQPRSAQPDTSGARAVTLAYSYAAGADAGPDDAVRGGAIVPLAGEEVEPIGSLAVFWRGAPRELGPAELSLLEELAGGAGPSLDSARRFREARQLADLDALTGLHNRRYFYETLAREVARAQRYRRRMALIVLDLDDFKAVNDRIGHLAGDGVLAEAAERVRNVVRSADVACRIGGDEFAVILPESTIAEAEQLYGRLQTAVSEHPLVQAGRLSLSAGIAELEPEESDPRALFERADEALYSAKNAGKGQVRMAAARGA